MAWSPQPGPQQHAIDAPWCDELLFGGARGGGKSDYLLGDYAEDVNTYGADWPGIIFRRTYPELEELIGRSKVIYPDTFPGAEWRETSKTWLFPSGARLRMRHLDKERDASNYQGHQYAWIGFDELTHWESDGPYRRLLACLRSAAGVPNLRVRGSANPGGPGHQWVKARFIDPVPGGYQPVSEEVYPGLQMTRMFIPSRLQDNKILMDADPGYIARLHMVGSDALVRAWLEGDWSVVEGAYFDNWSSASHVLRPCALPTHWTRFASFDWGSARPFSVGWYAVASEDWQTPDGAVIPKNAMVRYREWYGCKPGEPNVGLKMTVEEVADGIKEREGADDPATKEQIRYRVADPAVYIADGGPSFAERFLKRGVAFRPADNARVTGWNQVRQRLTGEDGKPMLYLFNTCADLIRTLPALQHDENKAEDVDTDGEDHAPDELRYACMSRPYTAPPPDTDRQPRPPTFNELRDQHARRQRARR